MLQPSVYEMKTSISHVATAPEHHAQYVVRVADPRTETTAWFLYKRYSEFRGLRDALSQLHLCPHCASATQAITKQFPRRHLFSSTSERVLDDRKVRLHHFLEVLSMAAGRFLDVPDLKQHKGARLSAAAVAPTSLLEFSSRKDRHGRLVLFRASEAKRLSGERPVSPVPSSASDVCIARPRMLV
ncbi:hypothetical protein SPRG_07921 [Saprolegnia parasitica CBS 223.65]|uniref:PX domain-containing protein n=1 Tax=Saprolegnia parasitica (strain CBS 223.65) TaxID=695850 RepID=A0A067C6V8_SAPPC|nr:hypothetical protein SPRG_07921 [Saprolegnia parasitica CBS 223.65]KDO26519.1 hypothetical protein SPRG_07921 [Saprolegnia parasitica CBS 223.65]|eukprot:XP_012202663.1 hypothetical protein SPRG_07921 [Saprolegnia parasitica CBS 223.65]